ncbi:hypothetical protein VNO77_22408 [Canavalia gladiata]|uniref:MORF/ORRM1/DAG-like MORF domain-containing protein n=1 Tax=Canavalia gladiata TaxID=3824 RepID=A0AAN9L2J2_CANGL
MASSFIRLRRTLRALSGVSSSFSATSTASFSVPIQGAVSSSLQPANGMVQSRSFRSSSITFFSVRSSQNNIPDEIGPDTILFEGCDYNHWLFVMDFPKDNKPSAEEMVRTYEETCAKGLNISVEEAKKKIYACSTTTYTGFQAVMTEEESKKFEGLPGVIFVLPDSYIDPVNKQYGGDQYIDGTIIPRPPPVQYGRNQGRRDRNRGPGQYNQNAQGNPSYNSPGSMPGDGRNYGPSQNSAPRQNYGQASQNYPPQQNYGQTSRNYPPQQNYGQTSQNYPPQQNFGQASQNYPPQQNYGPASQNYPPEQNYGQASQNYPPQQNYGQASQNYPPQQNYGQPSQNYPPQQNFDQASQHYPQQQKYGPASPQHPPQQNFGPPGQGERRNYVPNFGRPGQGERRDPVPRQGASGGGDDTFSPSYMKDFKPSYMEEFEQAGQGNYPAKEQTGSQQRYPPSGQGNFTGEGRY